MSSYNKRRSVYNSANHKRRTGSRNNNTSRYGKYIDPSRFVQPAKAVEVEAYVAQNQFSDFSIHPLLAQNIAVKGFITPTPIQDQTIPVALEGADVIGIANTGTGKTVAFAVPTMHKLLTDRTSRGLIIAPTRELAQQIEQECRWIAKGSGLYGALLIGGTAIGPQLRDLRNNPQVVIGTPGRIKDHIERRSLNLASFNIVVLDEVDRMLDMGFVDDVTKILNLIQEPRQSLFFSATQDARVQNLILNFTDNPRTISLKTGETSDLVDQNIVRYVGPADKIDKLHDILLQEHVGKTLVFDETQRSVERLNEVLLGRGFKADSIHGGKSQGQRQRALKRFKDSEIHVLVATDVAARGIDVADVTHVINFSQPKTYEDYVHRIGRAGRAGRTGYALTFIS